MYHKIVEEIDRRVTERMQKRYQFTIERCDSIRGSSTEYFSFPTESEALGAWNRSKRYDFHYAGNDYRDTTAIYDTFEEEQK